MRLSLSLQLIMARVYPCVFHEGTSADFCIVATDATEVVDIQHGSLEVDTVYQASSLALHKAILIVNKQTMYSKAVIFVPSLSTIAFINPVRLHSGHDSANLSLLVPNQHLITFYHGINRNSAGNSLASFCARNTTAIVSTSFLSTRQKSKHEIESRLESLWIEKWIRSLNGRCIRSFFPNVKSPRSLLTITMDRATAHVSGHSLLKPHQHRFGFVGNHSCECGIRRETIEHFFFIPFHSLKI